MGQLVARVREAEERLAGLARAFQSAWEEELAEARTARDDAARALQRAETLEEAAQALGRPELAARLREAVEALRASETTARRRIEDLSTIHERISARLGEAATPRALAPPSEQRASEQRASESRPITAEERARPPAPPPAPVEDEDEDEDAEPAAPPPAPATFDIAVDAEHEDEPVASAEKPVAPPAPPPAEKAPEIAEKQAEVVAAEPKTEPAKIDPAKVEPAGKPAEIAEKPAEIAEQPAEKPTDAPKADAPKPDAPKADAPKADAPKAEPPALAELRTRLSQLDERVAQIEKVAGRLPAAELHEALREHAALARLLQARFDAAGGAGATALAGTLAKLTRLAGGDAGNIEGLQPAPADWTKIAAQARARRQELAAARAKPAAG